MAAKNKTEYHKDTTVFSSIAKTWEHISEYTKRVCESVATKVKSLLGYKGKSDAWGGSDIWRTENSPKAEASGSGARKVLVATSFCVAGILAGLGISQVSGNVNEIASDTLHAVWLKQATTHDKQISLLSAKSDLEKQIQAIGAERTKLKTSEALLKVETTQLMTENKALKNQLVQTKKPSVSKTGKPAIWVLWAKKQPTWTMVSKQDAEVKQKTIDAELKKLLVLRNMKPVLKHEWVPGWVTDYKKYTKEQDASLQNIQKKIKMLQTKTEQISKSSASATLPVTTFSPAPSVLSYSPTSKWGKAADAKIGWLSSPSLSDAEVIISGSEAALIPTSFQLSDSLGGRKSWTLQTNTKLIFRNTNLFLQESIPSVTGLSTASNSFETKDTTIASSPSPSTNTPVSVATTSTPTSSGPETSIIGADANRSAITPANLTEENLQKLLAETDKILNVSESKHPLKWASLSMRQVTVKNIPAWRVYLKHGNRKGYFTLKSGHESRNYKIVSSPDELLKWVDRKMDKWKAS